MPHYSTLAWGGGGVEVICAPRCPQFIHTTDFANSRRLTPPDLQLLLSKSVAETSASRRWSCGRE